MQGEGITVLVGLTGPVIYFHWRVADFSLAIFFYTHSAGLFIFSRHTCLSVLHGFGSVFINHGLSMVTE
jgi:hypothetical protein